MYNRILVSGQVFDGGYSYSFLFGPWSPRGPRDDEARHSFPGPPLAVQVPDQPCNCFQTIILERNFVAKIVKVFDLTNTGGYANRKDFTGIIKTFLLSLFPKCFGYAVIRAIFSNDTK